MTTLLLACFIMFAFVGSVLVLVASILRCRHCGQWHESLADEANCALHHRPDSKP